MNKNKAIVSRNEVLAADGALSFDQSDLGAKGYNLVKLSAAKLQVPHFFVLTPQAFHVSLREDVRSRWSELDVEERRNIVESLAVSQSVLVEIGDELKALSWSRAKLAVRSSSADEDGTGLSYAGQFTSVLNVEEREIASAIERVWRSAFTKQLIAYRALNGLTTPPEPPCVIIQQMVPSIVAGVAFGANPVTGDREEVTISSVHGLGDKLVSGEVDSATYRLRGESIEERLNESIGPLTSEQLFAIKNLVDQTSEIFGSPQDIEWAIDKYNELFIVQSRPITTLNGAGLHSSGSNKDLERSPVRKERPSFVACDVALNERLDIFDNSNIGESYPGMTTPLTFSFARKAYQHVYETFCRMMGVSETAIQKHSFIFPQMLGLVRGRIYYNLINWYRLLSLFPGFKTNRGFMEQMMGVKAGLPAEFLAEFDVELPWRERVQDAVSMSISVPKLLLNWVRLPQDIDVFNARVEQSLARMPKNLSSVSTDELGKLYRSMEQDLLLRWDAPIVNDFFAMVSFGLLRGVCAKWFSNHEGLHNQLLCGETGIVSTEPVARMKELASIAARDGALLSTLQNAKVSEINAQLEKFPEFFERYQSYLEKFGDRCTGELKLESPTLVDNPHAFLSAIARLATEESRENNSTRAIKESRRNLSNRAQTNRLDAQQQAIASLGNNIVRSIIFNLILSQTRTRIRERENLRFMRTRVFGAVRRIFVEIGRRLEERGVLDSRQDIFFLETEEVLRFIDGTSTSSNLKAVVELRKKEFAEFETMAAPKDRFIIRGGLNITGFDPDDEVGARASCPPRANNPEEKSSGSPTSPSANLKGLGCCPGTLAGLARVIDDPNTQQLEEGEILVAKRTDPGWITVIAQARGIVVEYGSLLSHTAIVARELGIPTIVSVSNVTTIVKTGAWLEINGATGEVRVTSQPVDVALAFEATTDDDTETSSTGSIEMNVSEDEKGIGTMSNIENEMGARASLPASNAGEDSKTWGFCEAGKDARAPISEIQGKADFEFVRYAQCWEDTDIVIDAMNIKPGDTCLSIASAGDNSLAILARDPGKVVALDLNPSQLALLELKAAAFRNLSYEDMLVVLGYRHGKNRLSLFEQIKPTLSISAQNYWRNHLRDIEFGVATRGKFERYFEMFRVFSLPLTHSQRTVDQLLKEKSREERKQFFDKKWNTLRWRMLFKVFFSEFVMGALGRDPSFFTYAEGGLPGALMQWTRYALVDQDPSKNPYLHWILNGEFGSVLPNFLRKENFEAIKRNIDKLEWHQLSVEEYLSSVPNGEIDSFNLSDVFEYMSEDNYKSIMKLIAEASKSGARVVYWNMMAPRSSQASLIDQVKPMNDLSEKLFRENKTFFYSRFIVEEIDHQYKPLQKPTFAIAEQLARGRKGRAA